MYCPSCGSQIPGNSAFCPNCGARSVGIPVGDVSPKSRLVTTLLCALPAFMFGIAGVHRFYLEKIGTGILMLITLGGLGIWTLIDLIMVIAGSMKDKDGRPILIW